VGYATVPSRHGKFKGACLQGISLRPPFIWPEIAWKGITALFAKDKYLKNEQTKSHAAFESCKSE
jgi:hypothetical protein